jgi:hypothetical protein
MNDNFTRIVVILDRSGSMASVRESTVAGFNQFIIGQKKVPGEVTVKLVQFDDQYEVVFDKPLNDVPELTQATFVPRGSTALLDAQGRTIIELGAELAALNEDQRPGRVIVMTLTDGQENASREFAPLPFGEDREKRPELDGVQRIADMIKTQREVYGWDFIFLGANQDAVRVAASMNIPVRSSMTYSANPVGMANVMSSANNYVGAVRARGMSVFSDDDRVKAMANVEESQTVVVP